MSDCNDGSGSIDPPFIYNSANTPNTGFFGNVGNFSDQEQITITPFSMNPVGNSTAVSSSLISRNQGGRKPSNPLIRKALILTGALGLGALFAANAEKILTGGPGRVIVPTHEFDNIKPTYYPPRPSKATPG